MLRLCAEADLGEICAVVNDSARAYAGRIPAACWRDPYMDRAELAAECAVGVRFLGAEEGGVLVGVMGLQLVGEVGLIRHAYVAPAHQRRGVAGQLLARLRAETVRPLLVGTWAAAAWAITFYERHGFGCLGREESRRLLDAYWKVPETQAAASVVLADRERWPSRL